MGAGLLGVEMVEIGADIASLRSKLVGRKEKMGVVNEVIRGDGVRNVVVMVGRVLR